MLILLSPAKSLDFDTPAPTSQRGNPSFWKEAKELVHLMRQKSKEEIKEMMELSEKLAELNYQRFQEFSMDVTKGKQALWCFDGDVYQGLQAKSLNDKEIGFAQEHLRILSGLYGLLRPSDIIQPYRLEMGRKLDTEKGKNLYDFWQERITAELNAQEAGLIVNLASNEYFKAVKAKTLKAELISPVFKDEKNGKYKIISFYAKKARGLMARYLIENRITAKEGLLNFNLEGYAYDESLSKPLEPCFSRPENWEKPERHESG